MNSHSVGSLLVTDEKLPDQLVGIFTERDLLRNFNYLHNHPKPDRTIRVVMSKQLKTIWINQLHQAPQLMLDHGFRHLPVVLGETGAESTQLVGIISMRDLFKYWIQNNLIENGFGLTPQQGLNIQIQMHSKDITSQTLVSRLVNNLKGKGRAAQFFNKTGTPVKKEAGATLILDLDDYQGAEWTQVVLDCAPRIGRLTA